MSHAVAVKTQFKNIEVLKKAFAESGWTKFAVNSKARMYSSDVAGTLTYDLVAINPAGKFDIGVNMEDGCASFKYDPWDASIERQLGNGLSKVKQGYTKLELKKFLREQEMSCEIQELPNGKLKVIARA